MQAFANIEATLKSVGAGRGVTEQFTTYLVQSQDIPSVMAFRLREFPKLFTYDAYPPKVQAVAAL